MSIIVQHYPENHKAPVTWVAKATVNGVLYLGESRHGAVKRLARTLTAAGVRDDSLEVHTEGLPGITTHQSLFELAKWTYSEGSATNLTRVRWREPNFKALHDAANVSERDP